MDHSELVSDMTRVEKMPTQERLRLAKKRRSEQMRRFLERDKVEVAKRRSGRKRTVSSGSQQKKVGIRVKFTPSVMLLEAAARNDIEEVRNLLKQGVSPDSTNEDGLTALHQCCIDDNEEMMKLLLEFGADVNAEDSEKWTPLHAAATCGHLHLVKYLIQNGATLLAVNADGNMPYDICEDDTTLDHIEGEMQRRGVTQDLIDTTRSQTEIEMLKHLKEIARNGGSLDFIDSSGATPLHIAAANGYMQVAEFLLEEHHVPTDVVDQDGWQPIHAAACWVHPDMLELLFQNAADLDATTNNGETSYDLCVDMELRDRIRELRTEQERIREMRSKRENSSRSGRSNSNTRVASVRRTSMKERRDKARLDAKREAELWQQVELDVKEAENENDLESEVNVPVNYLNFQRDTMGEVKITLPELHRLQALEKRPQEGAESKSDEKRPKTEDQKQDVDKDSGFRSHDSASDDSNSNEACGRELSVHGGSHRSDVALDIHVTVTVNAEPTVSYTPVLPVPAAVTLAELKKQRSSSRGHNNGIVLKPDALPAVATTSTSRTDNGKAAITATQSPHTNRKKYVGEPQEMVGGSSRKTRCCVVM